MRHTNILTGRPVSASPDVVRLSDRLASGDKLRLVAGEILKKLDQPPDRTGRPACPAGRGQGSLSGRLVIYTMQQLAIARKQSNIMINAYSVRGE